MAQSKVREYFPVNNGDFPVRCVSHYQRIYPSISQCYPMIIPKKKKKTWKQPISKPIVNPIKPPFSNGFPMVFQWFPYGFPMVFQRQIWFLVARNLPIPSFESPDPNPVAQFIFAFIHGIQPWSGEPGNVVDRLWEYPLKTIGKPQENHRKMLV